MPKHQIQIYLRGVLLDIDGTLLDSNAAHARAWVDAFAAHGYDDVTFEQIFPLIGMGGDQLLPKVVPGLSDQHGQGASITSYRKKLFLSDFVHTLKPTPGSRDLVLMLQQAGLTLMIASSANPEELEALLKAAHVDDLLQAATTSGDADVSKPAPDIVQAALEKIQLPPEEVILIGDTPYDIESAGKAGVRAIALRCGGHSDAELAGAIAIYDHPADLLKDGDRYFHK